MNEIETILSIMESSTRRAILRKLLLEDSYGLELSRTLGISQQAINKQLDILEKANLILLQGTLPSSLGPPRKLYRPTGFLSVVIDYTSSFIQISKYNIDENTELREQNNDISIERVRELNNEMNGLMEKRQKLLIEKNVIIQSLRKRVNETVDHHFIRQILLEYLDSLNDETVSETLQIPIQIVRDVVKNFLE
jgi:predicted transcriptional regulator